MAIVDELIAVLGFELEGEDKAKKFNKTIGKLDNTITKFGVNAAKYGSMAAAAMGAMTAAFGKSIINVSAEFERYEAILTTVEGSADKAKDSMAWIEKFATKTPFNLEKVTGAFVKLKAYGIDPIANEALKTLGDAGAGMGTSLEQVVEAFADASTNEFERLKAFGITTQQEGDKAVFKWKQNGEHLTKTVKKTGGEIQKFLLENFGSRFGGAMDEQSKTWLNMVANIGDRWTSFQKRIGEAGFFKLMKEELGAFSKFLQRLQDDGTLASLEKGISDALVNTYKRMKTNFAYIKDIFVKNWAIIKPILIALGAALVAASVYAFPLIGAIGLLALLIDELAHSSEGGVSNISKLAMAVVGVIAAAKGMKMIIAIVKGVRVAILGLMAAKAVLWGFAAASWAAIGPWGLLAIAIVTAVGVISTAIWYFWDEIKQVFSWLNEKLNLDGLYNTITGAFGSAFKWVTDKFTALINTLKKGWDFVSGIFSSDPSDAAKAQRRGEFDKYREGMFKGMDNFSRNSNKIGSSQSGTSIVNDKRDQSQVNNIKLTQNVQQIADAPSRAAHDTAKAIANNFPGRTQMEMEPTG